MSGRLILATGNEKKKKEILNIIGAKADEVLTISDLPEKIEIVEDGVTFRENAIKKAVTVAGISGELALADDSGLEVDALDGRPGVYSARFAGEPSDDKSNNRKLLQLLAGVPDDARTARFKCVIAVAAPDGRVETAEGVCEGHITREPRGDGGFGYDPLFIPLGYQQTFGELPPTTKHRISHRGKALAKVGDLLKRLQPTQRSNEK
jgi:XTP/dITP diphosphohydrolase